MASIQTLLSELATKLTPRARDELDRLIASPEAEALLARDEESILASRRLLTKRLAEVAGKFAAAQDAAGRRAEAAAMALRAAEGALHAARGELVASTAQALAAQTGEADERQEIERELRDGADPRLAEFSTHALDLDGLVNNCFAAYPVVTRHWLSKEKAIEIISNRDQILEVRGLLKTASADALRAQLDPMTTLDVTELLQAHLSALRPLLAPLNLHLLDIDEHGNLTRDRTKPRRQLANEAIRAAGGTTDVSDELPTYDTAPNRRRAERALGLLA